MGRALCRVGGGVTAAAVPEEQTVGKRTVPDVTPPTLHCGCGCGCGCCTLCLLLDNTVTGSPQLRGLPAIAFA